MLLVASLFLVSGYTLLYSGVRGIHWRDPWHLLIGQPSASGGTPAGAPGAPAGAPSTSQGINPFNVPDFSQGITDIGIGHPS